MKQFVFFTFLLLSSTLSGQQPTEGFTEINGAKIYYSILGKGDPIIVVHGGPGLDQSYLYQELAPLSKNFQLIFYDQRLSGRSSANVDTNTISVDGFVADIEGLRQKLRLGSVTLLAHSFGGIFAMKYALNYPSNVKALVLVSSLSPSSEENRESENIVAGRFTSEDSFKKEAILHSDSYKSRNAAAYNKLMQLGFENQIFKYQYAKKLFINLPADFFQRSMQLQHLRKQFSMYDFYSELMHLNLPVLLVYGDYDPLSRVTAHKMKEKLPMATLIVLRECGHFPFLEQQKDFKRAVVKWYRQKLKIKNHG